MIKRYRLYSGKRSGAASVEVMLSVLGADYEVLDATPWSEPPGPAFEELRRVNALCASIWPISIHPLWN